MRLERLSESNSTYFNKAFALYEQAFPEIERRAIDEQNRILSLSDYHFDFIFDDDGFVGIMLYWETPDFIFLEHFAIFPEFRNRQKGLNALTLLKAKGKNIILEIEPPIDELTTRRYGFYRRNGFVMNDYFHIQAKYHYGDSDIELKLLSYPSEISESEYNTFESFIEKYVGIK